ncbi:MAG: hypothetical protein WC707_03000 [Candidatus Babeliaceae bacterium]|jgi:chromosome segregation ATPase
MKKNITRLVIIVLIAGQVQTALPYDWDIFSQSASHLLSNTYNILSNPFAQKICICLAGVGLVAHSYKMQKELNSLKTATAPQPKPQESTPGVNSDQIEALQSNIKELRTITATLKKSQEESEARLQTHQEQLGQQFTQKKDYDNKIEALQSNIKELLQATATTLQKSQEESEARLQNRQEQLKQSLPEELQKINAAALVAQNTLQVLQDIQSATDAKTNEEGPQNLKKKVEQLTQDLVAFQKGNLDTFQRYQENLQQFISTTNEQIRTLIQRTENNQKNIEDNGKRIMVLEKFKAKIELRSYISHFQNNPTEIKTLIENNEKINKFNNKNPRFILLSSQNNQVTLNNPIIQGVSLALYERNEHNPSGRSDDYIMSYIVLNTETNKQEWSRVKINKNKKST